LLQHRVLAMCLALLTPSLVVALAAPALSPHAPAYAAGDCAATVTSLDDSLTAGVWEHIMQFRASKGEARFEWSPNLAKAAAWMAKDSATRATTAGDTDSLTRLPLARATDCGYRADATVGERAVGESQIRVLTSDPYNVWMLWKQNDTSRMYPILYSPVMYPPTYTVGALGRYRDSAGLDYWVLNVGTLADTGTTIAPPTPTPAPSTATPTSAPTKTATSVPTNTATSVPTNTATSVPTNTATSVPTDIATSVPTDTATSVPTDTATLQPTSTATAQPTATTKTKSNGRAPRK
jgi:hypothetical protein